SDGHLRRTVDALALERRAGSGDTQQLHDDLRGAVVRRAHESLSLPVGILLRVVAEDAGQLDVVDGEAMEREGAVGHVLEAQKDLLAGVRGEIDLLLYPRRLSPARCPGEAV